MQFLLAFYCCGICHDAQHCKKEPEPLALVPYGRNIDLMEPLHRTMSGESFIVATFNVEVDLLRHNREHHNVQDYDDANVALTVSVSGKTITIVPQADLGTGALYQLSFGCRT